MSDVMAKVKNAALLSVPVVMGAGTTVTALASEGGAANAADGVAITEEMLAPITQSVTANIKVILPVALTLFGILVGIGLVKRILTKFLPGSGS